MTNGGYLLLCLMVSVALHFENTRADTTCNFIDSCSCVMSDGSGFVNLHSLALGGIGLTSAAFNVHDEVGGWYYSYNPCNGFVKGENKDLAVFQSLYPGTSDGHNLGVQSSVYFSYSNSNGLMIHYAVGQGERSRVLLVCQPEFDAHSFAYVGEINDLEYEFILTTPCACPGFCNDYGVIEPLPTPTPTGVSGEKTCDYIDSCTCEWSDGSGRVNLHWPALDGTYLNDGAFTVDGDDGWLYEYNPCNGFSTGGYQDLAIYQTKDGTWGFDLGVQRNASFVYSEASGLAVQYFSLDGLRKSRVLLVCQPDWSKHKFEFVGSMVSSEYDFVFASPCACAGGCENDGLTGVDPPPPPVGIVDTCNFIDSCTCEMSDGSGQVNLHGLATQTGLEASYTIVGDDGWVYKYNPCVGFHYVGQSDLAVMQISTDLSVGYDLGVQSSTFFNYTTTSGLTIHYQAMDSARARRSSRVLLICEPNLNVHTFEYLGELVSLEYDFVLTTPCACPGKCNQNGLINPLPTPPPIGSGTACVIIDSCTCEMSDGSGQINLHGTALKGTTLYDSAFVVNGMDGWYYKFNPCNGFISQNLQDLAMLQSRDASGSSGYDAGVQSSAMFSYSDTNGLSIFYKSNEQIRSSRVRLICQKGTTDHTLEFVGELNGLEYEFIFSSPCACPGNCDNDGVINLEPDGPPDGGGTTCDFVDSCTCDMSDGSGRINLHSLALEGEFLADAAFSLQDGYWTYKYNPCNGYTFLFYNDLAISQSDPGGSSGYDLGVQSSAVFLYNAPDEVSIQYTSYDDERLSRVLLVCLPDLNSNTFKYVGELQTLEYDFVLTTPCACPGLCDNDGPTVDLPTPPPPTGGDITCTYIDSCTCEMSDGSGRVNLHGPALEGDFLTDAAFTTLGSDAWYYMYNPCNGFAIETYHDLALFQAADVYASWGYDLGVQSSAEFNYTEASGLTIQYTAFDLGRVSRMLLICDEGNTVNKFEFVGELIAGEYDFLFTSPCACPGACDDNGVITQGTATTPPSTGVPSCDYVDSCTCEMSDGTGTVNLHSLALEGDPLYDAGLSVSASDNYIYKYNPCIGFSFLYYTNLAIAQMDAIGSYGYDLGVQSTAKFSYTTSNGLTVQYTADDGPRSSRVLLICEPSINMNNFEFVGEIVILEYDFILTSPCACPGMCDYAGPVVPLPTPPPIQSGVTCDFVDSCTCEMSDGSGRVNLHGLALEGLILYSAAFSVFASDFWYYNYNPCEGFIAGGYSDLAVFQSDKYITYGYDLGVQSTATFDYSESSGLTISYTAADTFRKSRIFLVCGPGYDYNFFEFVGELVITEYDFVLTSPCACPGACDNDGIIGGPPTPAPGTDTCTFVDECTCEMSDGSGQVNLHSLALEGPSLLYAAFVVTGYDGWNYRYNPCNGFTYDPYTNLAAAQVDADDRYAFDIGVQSSAYYNYTAAEGLAIQYTARDGNRRSRILLVCQPEINQNIFEYVGELITLQYEFVLSSPCACPGMCNNDGPITQLPTPSPGGNTEDVTCNYVDSCTCDMADGSGTINLHALALEDPYGYLYDSAFTILASDGWYYKYNPCNGFYFSYYYDVAIGQSSDSYGYGYGYDLGVESSAEFVNTESSGLAIKYTSSDYATSSRVLLTCEPNTNDHTFEYIGQLTSYEYEFMLVTPCACPGGCDDDGVISIPSSGTYCTKVDSCSCDMSDGSGRINLRSLGLKGDGLTEAAYTADGLDGWLYKYNPCNDFTYLYYTDLAIAQVNFHLTSGNDLGTQSSTKFEYSPSNGLSIHYKSADKIRQSRILLVCDPYAMKGEFEFVGELTTLEYDFILRSVCACPGGCNDFGVSNPVITQPPNGGNGGLPDNINVNVNQNASTASSSHFWPYVGGASVALIFHDILLILVIAAVIYISKRMAWCQGRQMQYVRMRDTATDRNNA